jgi:hypothetical protein
MEEICRTCHAFVDLTLLTRETLLAEVNGDQSEFHRRWYYGPGEIDHIKHITNIAESLNIEHEVDTKQIVELCSRIAGFEGTVIRFSYTIGHNEEVLDEYKIMYASSLVDQSKFMRLCVSLVNGISIDFLVESEINSYRTYNNPQATQEAQERINQIHAELGI